MILTDDVDLIVFDFDGVLTDNLVYVFEDGREAVRCNRADGLGFDMLRKANILSVILSSERNPVVAARGNKLSIPVHQGVSDKASAIMQIANDYGIQLRKVMFVANDLNDLSALRIVGWPSAVSDAHPAVLSVSKIIFNSKGGDGIVREIAENFFNLSF